MHCDGRSGGSYDGLCSVCLPRHLSPLVRGHSTLETPLQIGTPIGAIFKEAQCDWYLDSLVVNETLNRNERKFTDDVEEDKSEYDAWDCGGSWSFMNKTCA